MKITTETSRYAKITSWIIAIVGGIAFVLFIWLMPKPDKGELQEVLKNKKNKTVQKKGVDRSIKKQQAQRALPKNYSKQLVKQAEVLVKNNLHNQLNKFQEMSKKIGQRKDDLLSKIENRNLPDTAPLDANNTSSARNISKVDASHLGNNLSVKELYELLRQYELEIQNNNLAVNAAERTLSNGLSFPEVYNTLKMGSSLMSDFDDLIKNQMKSGKDWQYSENSNASAGLDINNSSDLNNYRGLLGQATREAGLAGARLESLFGTTQGGGKAGSSSKKGGGKGSGNGGMSVNFKNTGSKTPMNYYQGVRLDKDMIKSQALPGRRFSKDAKRKGWLYINTWYIIGPWENYGRDDFAIVHPPEVSVDLDATYNDGLIGVGVAETDSDPMKMIGEKVQMDGTLRWKFMQSQSMHNTVPVTSGHATYYGYTELYFDEATEMLVAIGTDDSGRVWINGKDVWRDKGTSWYYIDESIVPFQFQQGWNKVLVRLENGGGGPTGFSMLICPKEAVDSSMLDVN